MGEIIHSKLGNPIGVIVNQETERGGKLDVPGKPFNAHYTNKAPGLYSNGWKLGYFATHHEAERFVHASHKEHIAEREKTFKEVQDHADRIKSELKNIRR